MGTIKVLGIDPGLADTGIGLLRGRGDVIEAYSFGCIRTEKNDPLAGRLDHIFSRLVSLLEAEHPDLVVVEDVFSLPAYPASGITLGQVTGIILLAAFRAGVPVRRISVREAKQVMTGSGNAGKQQLAAAVRRLLQHDEPIRPDHASDALALAITGLFRYDRIS